MKFTFSPYGFVSIMILILFTSCTEVNYLIEEPTVPKQNSAPGSFEMQIAQIIDTRIAVIWAVPTDSDGDAIHFEISLNDSVIAYDIVATSYTIENLRQNSEYKISVTALDGSRNFSKAEKTVRTKKSFLSEVVDLGLNYTDITLNTAIHLNDGSIVLWGRGRQLKKFEEYKYFMVKLRPDYSLEWQKEYKWGLSLDDTPISVQDCSGNGFLAVQYRTIVKLDHLGNQQWIYKVPAEYNRTYFRSAVKDDNGDYMIVGQSDRNWPKGRICVEYFLMKISSAGNEIWHKYGGQYVTNYAEKIINCGNNDFLVAGVAEYTGSFNYDDNYDWKQGLWLLRVNGDGQESNQLLYPDQSNGTDMLRCIANLDDGSNIFMGGYSGYYYAAYTKARITKINPKGEVQWDVSPELQTPAGFFGYIADYDVVNKNEYLILAIDDRGITFSHLNINTGGVEKIIKLRGYPNGIFINYNEKGYYEYITEYGYLVRLNVDGYLSE